MRNRVLKAIEAVLYVAFLADAFWLLIHATDGRYEPAGGTVLVGILIAIVTVRHERLGDENYDEWPY